MKWLHRWLEKRYDSGANLKVRNGALIGGESVIPGPAIRPMRFDGSINFSIARANGGYIVEYHTYDRKTERTNNHLHIITDDKDLGEEIGKLISFEALRS